MTITETAVSVRNVALTIDGEAVEVAEGTSIHKACESAGIDTPTLCWAENLTPVNVCRVCVVEVEEIVPRGTLEPDQIHLPGIYVHRIVQGDHEKRIEQRTTRKREDV